MLLKYYGDLWIVGPGILGMEVHLLWQIQVMRIPLQEIIHVTLIATSDSGCVDTATHSVFSNPKPSAAIGPASVCLPDSAPFMDLSTISSPGQVTGWSWDFDDGGNSTLKNPMHLYTNPGVYHVHLAVTSDSGCVDTTSLAFDAFPPPGLDLGGDTLWLCPGNPFELLPDSNYMSYSWQDGSTDSTYLVTLPGTYHVTIVDSNGCGESDTVVVPEAPSPMLQMVPGDTVGYCSGSSIEVNANTPGVLAYLWSDSTTSSDLLITSPGTYTVIGWNDFGCTDTLDVWATEHPNPVVELGADLEFCDLDSLVLGIAGSYSSWNWSTGSTDSSLTVFTSGDYSLTVTDAQGCSGSDTIMVTVHPLPVVDLGPDSSLCAGDSMVLNAGYFVSYNWSTGDTTSSIRVKEANLYLVEVTDANDCSNFSNPVEVTVDPLPEMPIITKNGHQLELESTPELFYQWFRDGMPIFQATGQELIPDQTGLYSIEVTDANGCSNLSEEFYFQLEIYEAEMFEAITPNGDGKNDNLRIPSIEYYPDNELVIYGRWGGKVFSKKGYLNEFDGNSDQGKPLPDGTYFYILDLGNGETPIKGYFLIQR